MRKQPPASSLLSPSPGTPGEGRGEGSRRIIFLILIASTLAPLAFTRAAETKKITYTDDVLPVLRNSCLNCHNPDKKKSGLDLSTYSGLMSGSDDGKVVNVGDAQTSKLFRCVARLEEPYMPQKADKLPDHDLAVLQNWITQGALEDAGSKPAVNQVSLSVSVSATRPSGPPPMPQDLSTALLHKAERTWAPTALAASPWAPLIAIAGQHQVFLYHAQTLKLLGILPFDEGQPYTLGFSKNGKLLIAGGGEAAKTGKVELFNIADGKRVASIGNEFDSVLAADLTPDQTIVALGGPSKIVKGYATANNKLLYTIKKHTDWIMAIAISPDGAMLASGDRAGNLYIFEAKTGRELLTLAGHKESITSLSFRDDSKVFASASQDGTIKFWDLESGATIRSIAAHTGGVLGVRFGHDGKLVSCGRDNAVKTWAPDGSAIKTLTGLKDISLEAAFTDDQSRVIGADWTGAVNVWQSPDGKLVGQLSNNPPP